MYIVKCCLLTGKLVRLFAPEEKGQVSDLDDILVT